MKELYEWGWTELCGSAVLTTNSGGRASHPGSAARNLHIRIRRHRRQPAFSGRTENNRLARGGLSELFGGIPCERQTRQRRPVRLSLPSGAGCDPERRRHGFAGDEHHRARRCKRSRPRPARQRWMRHKPCRVEPQMAGSRRARSGASLAEARQMGRFIRSRRRAGRRHHFISRQTGRSAR